MPMFVVSERVPVSDGTNTIYIRAKMDLGTRNRVSGALVTIEPGHGGQVDISGNLGAYNMALMVENILDWEGPDFAGVPCTPGNIARLDPDAPLVERVIEEIAHRNPIMSVEEPSKKGEPSTSAGGQRSKARRSGLPSGTST